MCGDVGEVLDVLNESVKEKLENEWNMQIEEWKRVHPLSYKMNGSLSPQYIIESFMIDRRASHNIYGSRSESDVGCPVL